jgi:ribosome-associated protein
MPTIEFQLDRPHIALCDLLKLTGIADSSGRGKAMVAEGLVKVDGTLESRKTAKILVGQRIECQTDSGAVFIQVKA